MAFIFDPFTFDPFPYLIHGEARSHRQQLRMELGSYELGCREEGKTGDSLQETLRRPPALSEGDIEAFLVKVSVWDPLMDRRCLAVVSTHCG